MIGGTPLTAEMMADAFDCFWNAALVHQHPTVEGFNAISVRLQEFAGEAQERRMKILLGVLGNPQSDMRIGFVDRCWTLATGEGDSYEVLCRHEDFNQFLELVNEYSDYVESE